MRATADQLGRLRRRRLANLRLTGPTMRSAPEVVRHLLAVQSQEVRHAKWSLAQRLEDATETALDRLIAAGKILRTHVLRPTWHFVHPKDIHLLLAAAAARVHARNRPRYRQLGLDDKTMTRADAVLARACAGDARPDRADLAQALERANIKTTGQRLPYLLMHAELNGILCSHSLKGQAQTYAKLDERVRDPPEWQPEDAVAELVGRYLVSHGPATVKDLQAWASVTAADVRAALTLDDDLQADEIGGITYWSSSRTAQHEDRAGSVVRLLQPYEEYLVGYRESRFVVDPHGQGLVSGGALCVDGVVEGRWARTIGRGVVDLSVTSRRPLNGPAREALEAEVERYGRFLGLPVRLALHRDS